MKNLVIQWRLIAECFVAIACFVGGFVVSASTPRHDHSDSTSTKTEEPANGKMWGEFLSDSDIKFLPGSCWKAQVQEELVYIDPHQQRWVAKPGTVVNGASIPRILWTPIGGPWLGRYRDASILHDVACKNEIGSSDQAHQMFYEACRCRGVPELKAKVMYAAVYHYGPNWPADGATSDQESTEEEGQLPPISIALPFDHIARRRQPDAEVYVRLGKYVREHDPSLEEIKQINPNDLPP